MKLSPVVYNYQYNDNEYDISFLNEIGGQMINATEMIKPFGKQIIHFLEDPTRREIVILLCKRNSLIYNDNDISLSLTLSDLAKLYPESIKVVKGGIGQQGTWMHEDIALEFARWLSPKFAIWCNDRIKENLRKRLSYSKTTEKSGYTEHICHTTQKEKSKAVAIKNYGIEKNTGRIVYYFRDVVEKVCGLTPVSLKSWARKNNIPLTIINKGGREILRFVFPEKASVISLIDDLYASDPTKTIDNLDELIDIGKGLEPIFLKLSELGYGDLEDIKYLEHNKQLMLKRTNEK